MASADLRRRVETVVGYPPLSELGELQRREFDEALLEAATFEDLPGKWQAAILMAGQNRPKLRVVKATQSRARTATGPPEGWRARALLPVVSDAGSSERRDPAGSASSAGRRPAP
jgi:hypothetical protein